MKSDVKDAPDPGRKNIDIISGGAQLHIGRFSNRVCGVRLLGLPSMYL